MGALLFPGIFHDSLEVFEVCMNIGNDGEFHPVHLIGWILGDGASFAKLFDQARPRSVNCGSYWADAFVRELRIIHIEWI